MKILFLEIGTSTRGHLLPNPNFDTIRCVAFSLICDRNVIDKGFFYLGKKVMCGMKGFFFESEHDLIAALTKYILDVDPDILIGFNNEKESFHYIHERSKQVGYQNW